MQQINTENITNNKLNSPIFLEKKITLSILRLDKIHPEISGNKWFKLKFYLEDAIRQNKKTIVTFGGAWSNHILATAAICMANGLQSIGLIRGEAAEKLSPTLIRAKKLGMKLIFLNREDYKNKKVPAGIISPDSYLINEGGYGKKGVEGAATILNYCNKEEFTHICCAAGTGTMAAGILSSISKTQKLVVISVLKNYFDLHKQIELAAEANYNNLLIVHDFHFGGYAKKNQELIGFMNEFYKNTEVPTDFVYTGKLCYAISTLIEKNYFPINSKLLVIHSGGLQGNASLSKGTLIF